jgi:hypothetical protein
VTTVAEPAAPAASAWGDDLTPEQRRDRARAFATLTGKVIDPYSPEANAETFDLDLYLSQFDPKLMSHTEGRKALTCLDPMLFALTYMRKHLKNNEGQISFSDAHFLWVRAARRWIGPPRGQREDRKAFVAPRACGKSTWFFLILVMWAGAHGHVKFAAAFADSGAQAELHLATFKAEHADNALLRTDFPELCNPARRHTGRTVADNQNMLHSRGGFTFVAKGIDSTSLGMKMGATRPDLLIFDDIEPPEATYSPFQRDKRLSTVENAILPLNELARVVFVGTVTMPGSIIHELVRHSKGEEVEPWVDEQKVKTYHTRPIITRDDGTERSVWPAKWPIAYLQSIRHTRSYKLNYDNDPKGRSGDYWDAEDFVYGTPANITKWFLFLDPPVTQKTRSDECGIALLGYAPGIPKSTAVTREELTTWGRDELVDGLDKHGQPRFGRLLQREALDALKNGTAARLSRVHVAEAWGVKLTGKRLRAHVMGLLLQYPQIKAVIVESNQGGDLWVDVLDDLPVRLVTYGAKEGKEVKFARALDLQQRYRITFSRPMPALEDQALAWPRVPHDDVLDAVCSGALRLLTPKLARKDGTLTPR